MEPAPELAAFIERHLKNWQSGDIEAVIDSLSRHAGLVAIGTDPEEWWEGHESTSVVHRVQFREYVALGGLRFDIDQIVAWKEGAVGWIVVQCRGSMGKIPSIPMRMTFVVHEEGAYWRIVHYHYSVAVPNESVLGTELTTSVDQILMMVQNEVTLDSSMADDGSVTIMFTDIEGSTVLMESLGEQRWPELLAWHDGIVRQQTAIFGGTVVKGQGDGFMLSFPAIGSAAACAMAVQRSLAPGWAGVHLPVRIGLHVGNARAEGGDFFGRTVVVAARVANAAAGGEILVSQAVQEGLGGSFPLDGARSLSLKGLVGSHAAFPMIWQ